MSSCFLVLVSCVAMVAAVIPSTYDPVVEELWNLYTLNPDMAPKAVRLAWHSSGTYIAETGEHGSDGGHIRFDSVLNWDSNLGLKLIMDELVPIYDRFDGLTYADLVILSGVVAIDFTQGPLVDFCGGRIDMDEASSPPDTLLPPAAHPDDDIPNMMLDNIAQTSFDVYFKRMGFTAYEMVALMATHSLGRMNAENSGFVGTWDTTPHVFDNMFFLALSTFDPFQCYTLPNGEPIQYAFGGDDNTNADCSTSIPQDPELDFNMNPFDLSLKHYAEYAVQTDAYALNTQLMFDDFGPAWHKLLMLGVTCDDSIEIVDLNDVEEFFALDIFNLGAEGTAQLSFVLLVAVLSLGVLGVCVCACGLDAKIKLAVHPSITKSEVQGGGYKAMYD